MRDAQVRTALALALLLATPLAGRAAQPSAEHARSLAWEGRLDESLVEYDAVLSTAPEARDARLGRARVLGWLGRHAESLAALEAIHEDQPDDPEALVLHARVLGWTQRYAEAEARARRALVLAPDFVEAQIVLGDVLAWSQQREEAELAYREALRLAPDSREAQEGLRRLETATQLRRARVDFGLRFDSLDGNRGDWWREALQLAFRAHPRTSLFAGVTHYRRYDEHDAQGNLGVALAAPGGWWLGADATLGPKAKVVARYAFGFELARRLHERAMLQLRYRHSWYVDDVETDTFVPGVELRPIESLVLAARYHFTHVSGGHLGHAGSLRAELFPEDRWSAYAVLGYGSEAFAPSTVQSARTHARTISAAAGLVWRPGESLGLRLGYAFQDLEGTYQRHGIESGVQVEF
jgi:YaiO family outer membrane protein